MDASRGSKNSNDRTKIIPNKGLGKKKENKVMACTEGPRCGEKAGKYSSQVK
jgi:hypothetical protein